MKNISIYILYLLFALYSTTGQAQSVTDEICRIEDGRLIFKLNPHWDAKERRIIAQVYALDSALIAQAFQADSVLMYNNEKWYVNKTLHKYIELSKVMTSESDFAFNKYNNEWIVPQVEPIMLQTESLMKYGINEFKDPASFSYTNGLAHFYLPGYKNAQKIYLSGSFNAWRTQDLLMQKTDDGWIVSVKMLPGKAFYKYIVDGQWILDPENKLEEPDNNHVVNSVVYIPNYTFRHAGNLKSKKVAVSGNFNNWNRKGIPMQKTSRGWELPIYLKDGTYTYKFVVDKNWILDSGNPLKRTDADGNENSVLEIGEKYFFHVKSFAYANQVILTGSFNNWITNELMMHKTDSGWVLPYVLASGNYEYKFIVDGRWSVDSLNPHTIGFEEVTNSVLTVEPNYTFELEGYDAAKKVIVSGSFNGWNPTGYTMTRQGNKWVIKLHLDKGKHRYKFIVDGEWIQDPTNPVYDTNQYNTYDSVLWIEQ